MSLERVIAEQQERIDRLEKRAKTDHEYAQAEWRRYFAMFNALQDYISEVEMSLFPRKQSSDIVTFNRERYFKLRDTLRKNAEAVGYCWRCEHYGCVCSDDVSEDL